MSRAVAVFAEVRAALALARELDVGFEQAWEAALTAVPFGDVARSLRQTEEAWRRAYERKDVTRGEAGRGMGRVTLSDRERERERG